MSLYRLLKKKRSYFMFLHSNFNNSLSCSTFTTAMKYANVKPIHKNDDKIDKAHYWPRSILPNLSKIYERIMYNQICLFHKWFNAQYCLLLMIEKWREVRDKVLETGTVLADFSKAFDNSLIP